MAEQKAEEKLYAVKDKEGKVHMLSGINKTDAVNQLGWTATGDVKIVKAPETAAEKAAKLKAKEEADKKAKEDEEKLKQEEADKKTKEAEAKLKQEEKDKAAKNTNGQTGTNK